LLSLGFAALLVVTIYLMSLRKRLGHSQQEAPATYRLGPTAGIGLLAGLLSGLFGVGGGVVMVPLQTLILGEPIKAAVRNSLGAIVLIAASGLFRHGLQNNVLWVPGLCLGLGGIVGAQYGARLLPKLPERTVSLAFRALLLAMAVYMVARAL
ncbi:MAG: sulfite exporter TauE/SafE family protein, partial [Cyanobacteria bacterium P01_A01_bin.135]